MKCRHCQAELEHTFLDLGYAPPSNAYRTVAQMRQPEITYPLKVLVCASCWLVQTEDYAAADALFAPDYAYFSSTSTTWLTHAEQYAQRMITELGLTKDSLVMEVASNDGYLLRNFVQADIPCLGIEPTDSTAAAAEALGIPVVREFFGEALARELVQQGQSADLIAGNNVYAHVPDINDFTRGLAVVLKTGGTITLEFPHLMRLIEFCQFDTIYHEHFSYLSLHTVSRIFAAAGLKVIDVEELPTHGGSLRVFGAHVGDARFVSPRVNALLETEQTRGLLRLDTYLRFQQQADRIKDALLVYLLEQKSQGRTVVAYGAAAKGNTLLNFAGVRSDLVRFVCDAAAAKQGKFMPGSHIPILAPSAIPDAAPDVVLVLPWNLLGEIQALVARMPLQRQPELVVAVPELSLH